MTEEKVPVSPSICWFVARPLVDARITTADGCLILFVSQFLTAPGAEALYLLLEAIPDLEWESGPRVPRLIRWYGPSPYRFGGRHWEPHPYEPLLREFQACLQQRLEEMEPQQTVALGSCLVNKYRNGKDSVAKHSDNEPQFGFRPHVASISLGVTRTFFLRRRRVKSGRSISFPLAHGSLLFMGGRTQELYSHWINKEPRVQGVRYNLTFRPFFQPRPNPQ